MRPVSKNIPFVKSERALADFARQDAGVQQLFKLDEEQDDEIDLPQYSDSEEADSDIWPDSRLSKKKKSARTSDFKM